MERKTIVRLQIILITMAILLSEALFILLLPIPKLVTLAVSMILNMIIIAWSLEFIEVKVD